MSLYDGLTPADLAARVRAPSCLVLSVVTSTLDIVHELAREGAPAGTVVLADEQVRGRGRQGRSWHSPRGAGIWLGYLMRPDREPPSGVLALRVGLALRGALRHLGLAPRLKWPNDVLLGDRKAAGILCEARWKVGAGGWVAAGVGINVHGPLPDHLRADAVALDEAAPGISRITVLEVLIPRLHALGDATHLTLDERRALRTCDWLAGRELKEPVPGRACGIDADGALLVDTAGGRRRVFAGSVVAV